MQFPIQAQPVIRTRITAADDAAVVQLTCDWGNCASAVVNCIVVCTQNPGSRSCIHCFGPLYDKCIDCVL